MVTQHTTLQILTSDDKEQEEVSQCFKSVEYRCMSMSHKHDRLPCLRLTGSKGCASTAQNFMERTDLAPFNLLPTRANTTLTQPPVLNSPPGKPYLLAHTALYGVMQSQHCAPTPPCEIQLTSATHSPAVSKPRDFSFS